MDFWSKNSVPKGLILIWSGAIVDIPAGWALCDGTNGTPNMKDKFVVCAGDVLSVDDVGGDTSHTHTGSGLLTNLNLESGDSLIDSDPNGDFNPILQGGAATLNIDAVHNRPPYFCKAYIIKL